MGFLRSFGAALLVVLVLLACAASGKGGGADYESTKLTRNRLERRMPTILRVGKRYGQVEDDAEIKRYPKFMAFPRVGRTGYKPFKVDLNDGLEKRNDPKPGMWFGPRLGRTLSERNIESSEDLPWAYIIFSENPLEKFLKNEVELSESEAGNNDNADTKASSYVESA